MIEERGSQVRGLMKKGTFATYTENMELHFKIFVYAKLIVIQTETIIPYNVVESLERSNGALSTGLESSTYLSTCGTINRDTNCLNPELNLLVPKLPAWFI